MRCSRCGEGDPRILQDFGVFEYYVKKDWNVSHAFDVHFLGFVREGLCENCIRRLQQEGLKEHGQTPLVKSVGVGCALFLLGLIMYRTGHLQVALLAAVIFTVYVVFQIVSARDAKKALAYRKQCIQEAERTGYQNLMLSSLPVFPEALRYEVLINLDGAPGTEAEKAPLPPKREQYERNFAAIRTVRKKYAEFMKEEMNPDVLQRYYDTTGLQPGQPATVLLQPQGIGSGEAEG